VNLTRSQHLLVLPLAALAFAIAAIGPWSLPAPESALAAGCPGADSGPRKISSKRAAELVVCLVNNQRAKRGMSKFDHRRDLAAAARSHSKRMQKTDCFDHVCPGESPLVVRYEHSNYLPCGCSWGASENIAWGAGSEGSPREIVKSWMGSSDHRANILGSYEHVGVGVRWGSPQDRSSRAGTYTLDFGFKH
jgi:uncharacterized protein YkwD